MMQDSLSHEASGDHSRLDVMYPSGCDVAEPFEPSTAIKLITGHLAQRDGELRRVGRTCLPRSAFTLGDRYLREKGWLNLSGGQALVRMLRDRAMHGRLGGRAVRSGDTDDGPSRHRERSRFWLTRQVLVALNGTWSRRISRLPLRSSTHPKRPRKLRSAMRHVRKAL